MRSCLLLCSVLALCLGVFGACGGSSAEEPLECTTDCGGDPIPAAMVPDLIHRDLCRALTECRSSQYETADQCVSDRALSGVADFLADVESGAVRYDAAKAGECHAAFAANPCEFAGMYLFTPSIYEILKDCGALTGQVQTGSACVVSEQCVDSAYCESGATCPGLCTARGGVDAACLSSNQCAVGFSCTNDDLCKPYANAGEACTWDGDCVDELRCDEVKGICAPPLGEGDSCTRGVNAFPCEYGLYCSSKDSTPGVCKPRGGVGAPCSRIGLYDACLSGLDCNEPAFDGNGVCAEPAGLNESCATGLRCDEETRCVEGVCVALAGLGEACVTYWGAPPCASGLQCDGTTCLDARVLGERCGPDVGACVVGTCVGGVCERRAVTGESCDIAEDCATFSCGDDGVCVDPLGCR